MSNRNSVIPFHFLLSAVTCLRDADKRNVMVKDVVSCAKLVGFYVSETAKKKPISVAKTNLLSLYFVACFGSRRVVVVIVIGVVVVVVVVVGVLALFRFLLLSLILINWKINPANKAHHLYQ